MQHTSLTLLSVTDEWLHNSDRSKDSEEVSFTFTRRSQVC
jgi:hypothetical protein